jgi:hypothetical protein
MRDDSLLSLFSIMSPRHVNRYLYSQGINGSSQRPCRTASAIPCIIVPVTIIRSEFVREFFDGNGQGPTQKGGVRLNRSQSI